MRRKPIAREFADQLALDLDALLRFTDTPAREFERCFTDSHAFIITRRRRNCRGKAPAGTTTRRRNGPGRKEGLPRPKRTVDRARRS